MNRILAIAGLTLRGAVRSKVFTLLVVLVLGGIIGLPLIMKSDGSLGGQVRLFLEYTLGLTVLLLSVMAVWIGAGAVSLEVENSQIQLVAVKPVRALEIWIGKWLGLMVINVILLAVAGAMIYGLLGWTTRPLLLSAQDRVRLREEILVARRQVLPETQGAVRGGANGSQAVAPGQTGHWQFDFPRGTRAGEHIFLRFRFVTSRPDLRTPVPVLWQIGIDGNTNQLPYSVLGVVNQEYSFRIAVPAGSRRIEATCVNMEVQKPVTLLFSGADSVKLLVNASRFEANYLRALLMVLARLAFFSALGLTAGAVFSFPVAAFVALALLLMATVNRWLQVAMVGEAGADQAGSIIALWDWMMHSIFRALGAIMPNLDRWNSLDFLPDGRLISWGLAGQAWLMLVGVYAVILALLGAWWFSRRELGLPAE